MENWIGCNGHLAPDVFAVLVSGVADVSGLEFIGFMKPRVLKGLGHRVLGFVSRASGVLGAPWMRLTLKGAQTLRTPCQGFNLWDGGGILPSHLMSRSNVPISTTADG